MDARTARGIITGNRRRGNELRRLRREFFEEPLREVRKLLAEYIQGGHRPADDYLVGHWQNEISGYENNLRRIDEGIMRCEEAIAEAWRELRHN